MRFWVLFTFLLLFIHPLYSDTLAYTVKKGDTLYSISKHFNVPTEVIVQFNQIKDPTKINIGLVIEIPQRPTHMVQKGDTLYSLAQKYGTIVAEITALNNMQTDTPLFIGDVLLLPMGSVIGEDNNSAQVDGPEKKTQEASNGTNGLNVDQNDNKKELNDQDNPSTAIDTHQIPNGTSDQTIHTSTAMDKNPEEKPFWPIQGKHKKLEGKLSGIQIETNSDTDVLSISTGKVIWVAPYRGYGTLVIISHKDKYYYAYGGDQEPVVNQGDIVEIGTKIGSLLVRDDNQPGFLYLFVYKDGVPIDPEIAPRS